MSDLKPTEPILYRERVTPNLGAFAAAAVLIPAIALVSEPFDLRIGLVIGPTLVLGIWAALFFWSPVIIVDKKDLSIGRASIPRELLGEITEIPKDQIFNERGPALNPASFKVFQGTVKTAVKVMVKDPKDPTPYWIVSTRKPTALATALKATV